ncbi:Conserved_hypothetical protein [Hexamita inflata]|uniref:Uncharacterized protein n=1 Tax=Hexamita inflata TaxID=28002 RepID=A0AA86P6F8_9EUKA|nr:Conserved hypothetical protein [Hexamita inflata]
MNFSPEREQQIKSMIQTAHAETVAFCKTVKPGKFSSESKTTSVAKFDVDFSSFAGIVAKTTSNLKISEIISNLRENPFLLQNSAPFKVTSLIKYPFGDDFVFVAQMEGKMGTSEQLLTFSVQNEGKQTVLVQKWCELEEIKAKTDRTKAINVFFLEEKENKTEITFYSHQDIPKAPAIILNMHAKKRAQVLERFE